jgi:hypothetical protein
MAEKKACFGQLESDFGRFQLFRGAGELVRLEGLALER